MMRWLKGLLVGLLVLIPLSVQARPAADWQIVVYEWERGPALDQGGALDIIDASGVVARHLLPASILPGDRYTIPVFAVSDDWRYAAVAYSTDDMTSAPPVSIYDLKADSCCVVVTPPLANPQTYSMVGFSADGSQLAFAYAAFPDPNNRMLDGGLVVADVTSGAVMAALDLKAVQAATGQASTSFAQPLDWTAQGIRFVPGCWMCEGTIENSIYVWNPATGAVTKDENGWYSVFADTLPLTGELLYTVDNTAFPSGQRPGYIPPANVVEYYAGGLPDKTDSGRQTSAPNATLVYHDPNNLNLPRAVWVADGRAFLLQGSSANPTGTLVFRDQTQLDANFGESDRFIAPTPDGWLVQDAARTLNHYVVAGGTLKVEPLGQLASRVYAVWSPPMGQAGLPPFVAADVGPPSG